jgi:hypothetical protein
MDLEKSEVAGTVQDDRYTAMDAITTLRILIFEYRDSLLDISFLVRRMDVVVARLYSS